MIENIQHIEIEIDKITNSIENAISGDNFRTNVSLVVISDFKSIKKKTVGFSIGKMNLNKQTVMSIS